MKIRNDFVTNSSSSSFIITTSDSVTEESIVLAINSLLDAIGEINPIYKGDKYEDIFDTPYIITEKDVLEEEEYLLNICENENEVEEWRKFKKEYVNCICIDESSENSIPSVVNSFLEDELDAVRYYNG